MITIAFLLFDKAFKLINYFDSFKLRDIFETIKEILYVVWLFIGTAIMIFIV